MPIAFACRASTTTDADGRDERLVVSEVRERTRAVSDDVNLYARFGVPNTLEVEDEIAGWEQSLRRGLGPTVQRAETRKPCGECAVVCGYYALPIIALTRLREPEQERALGEWFCHTDGRQCRGARAVVEQARRDD